MIKNLFFYLPVLYVVGLLFLVFWHEFRGFFEAIVDFIEDVEMEIFWKGQSQADPLALTLYPAIVLITLWERMVCLYDDIASRSRKSNSVSN